MAGERARGSNVSGVVARLADLALRRPWALLGGNLAVLAVAVVLAAGAPDRLGVGSLDVNGGPSEPDLIVATTGKTPVRSGVYRVALQVISSQVRSDPAVASVRRGKVSANGRSTALLVTLEPDDAGDRQEAVDRIEDGIDPGPLRVAYGGEVATALDARDALTSDLWKLELLALPLALLLLTGAFGLRFLAAPVIGAATGVAGSLAALRLVGAVAHLSLLGMAPAAVVGLVIGIEAPAYLLYRFRDEATTASPLEALHRALGATLRIALPLVGAAIAVAAGLLATPLDQAPSIVLATGLAAALAVLSALASVPALLTLGELRSSQAPGAPGSRAVGLPSALGGFLARSGVRTAIAAAIGILVMLAASAPLRDAQSRPFSAADLPSGSQARSAAPIAASASPGTKATARSGDAAADQSLFPKLPLAAGVSAAALLLVLLAAFRSLRVVPVMVVSLLPAAAACGLAVLVLQEGHLASAIGLDGQGALETGAVASLLVAVGAVSAIRSVVLVQAARNERGLALEPERVAEATSGLTLPAVATATMVAGVGAGLLVGTDLYSAKEFGLAVAAGLFLDLVLLRLPLTASLARWGGGGH